MIIYLVCTFRGILQYTAIYFKEVKWWMAAVKTASEESEAATIQYSPEELKRVEQVQSKS